VTLFLRGVAAAFTASVACTEPTDPTPPATPQNVTATLLTPTSALVSWSPSAANDGVVSYSVLRNGAKVGESTSASFTDTGLSEQTTYKYSVSANGASGLQSPPSAETAAATVSTPDMTAPVVTASSPANGSAVVSTFASLTVTFSEPMDPATVNATTFTLKVTSGGAIVPGTVTYTPATSVAEFKPASQLPSTTNFTGTVVTGAKDMAGNPLTAPFTFSFTTLDQTPPTVTGTSPLNGATGVSATTQVVVTFSEALDAATINAANVTLRVTSTNAPVAGAVTYDAATHAAVLTPNAALSAAELSYTAAVSVAVKDVAGNALAASVEFAFTTADATRPSVVSTVPANLATNVSPSIAVTATFDKSMDPATINAATFTLRLTGDGGFVAGVVGYDSGTRTATFTPSASLGSVTGYTAAILTGVKDVLGNTLASSISWTFITADNVPPAVTAVSPADGAVNVQIATSVVLTFSEQMSPASISGATITLRNGATSADVPATVAYDAATTSAILAPLSPLSFATVFAVTVSTAARDIAGNALANAFTSGFTTASAPDVTPPAVVSAIPANGATNVPVTSLVKVIFSEAMNPASVNASTIVLKQTATGTAVAGAVSYDVAANSATLTPAGSLSEGTAYTLTVAGPTDVAGNALVGTFSSGFTTVAVGDVTPPTVVSTSPADGATNVPTTVVITATFSETMDPATVNATTFSVNHTGSGVSVSGPVTYDAASRTATLTPSSPLTNNATYLGTITTGAKDVAGNPLSASVPFAFTVAAPAPSIVVVTVDPAQRFQTIEGWGISMRLFADPHIIGLPQDDPGNALQIPASAQSDILDSLYRGIGLTRVRVGNEPGGIEPTNDNGDPFNTDLTKFDFSGRNNDSFLPVVADLRGRGMTHWWMSPIEIESFMNESNPDEYVEWAMAINRRWRGAGLEMPYFSLANEPTLRGLPLQSGAYLLSLVKKLGQRLRAEGFATKIVIPDDVNPSSSASYAQTILADADARQYVGAIAYHLYDRPITASSAISSLSAQYGIPLWMSEFYTQDWMEWATIVHSLLADYNTTVVDYLAGFLGEEYGGGALASLIHSGTAYGGYRLQPQYYSYGNFTRYVRPGAVRVAASSPDAEVQVSAFVLAGRLTLIGINHRAADVTVRFNLGSGSSTSAFSSVRTSASEHLVPLAPVSVSAGSIVVVLKATSVTTVYQ